MTELSRRSFFGALAAAGAVAALPRPLRRAALSRSSSTITISAATGLIKRGDVFTIAGVYSAGTTKLQQFTVLGAHGNQLTVEPGLLA